MKEMGPIPGERDGTTLTHRQPGAMGGDPYGADIPPSPPEWQDDETRRAHELEGGGAERDRRREGDQSDEKIED
jgi:hypothetical protein